MCKRVGCIEDRGRRTVHDMWCNWSGNAVQLSAIFMLALAASFRCWQQIAILVCKHLCWLSAWLFELAQVGISFMNLTFGDAVLQLLHGSFVTSASVSKRRLAGGAASCFVW